MCTCFLLGNLVCCDFKLFSCFGCFFTGFGKIRHNREPIFSNVTSSVKMQKSLENINALVLQFCEKL